ncbi:hypothetical protein O181_091949 [Austropuccinia psidii MF-1]|uniref:Uncharacterized protein n=1 Tax=Austropuccinia psidii MF-1 TaxID=1389203 RepID=A0A9Q3IYJ5_9BASI|nr:hypothetical protein [Austropuccinia psidii MF-1]
MPPTPPLYLCPHQSLRFCTPAAYNHYPPAAPSGYASNATLNPPYAFSHRPNPLLQLPSLCSLCPLDMPTLLQCCPPISALTAPYSSAPLPLTILTLPPCPQDMPPTPP